MSRGSLESGVTSRGREEWGGREGGEDIEEEEVHTLLFIPSPPPPQELCSDSALQGVVNVFHLFFVKFEINLFD